MRVCIRWIRIGWSRLEALVVSFRNAGFVPELDRLPRRQFERGIKA